MTFAPTTPTPFSLRLESSHAPHVFLTGALVLATTALPLHAQDEAQLRRALEGKRITLKMDMPATSEGVDVFPGSSHAVDYDKVGKRMKKAGISSK